jgi:hypothetical protein
MFKLTGVTVSVIESAHQQMQARKKGKRQITWRNLQDLHKKAATISGSSSRLLHLDLLEA